MLRPMTKERMVREFHTAAKKVADGKAGEETLYTFMHDVTEVSFREPEPAQWALMMTAAAGYGSTTESMPTRASPPRKAKISLRVAAS